MKNKRRILIVGTIGVFIAIIGATGWVFYQQSKPSPDTVFRSYIEKALQKRTFGFEQTSEGTNIKTISLIRNDINKKIFDTVTSAECKATYRGEDVRAKLTFRQSQENTYFKIIEIAGVYKNSAGREFDMAKVMERAKGNWYQSPQPDAGIKSLLDSGIAAYNSALLAPTYNTATLADDILNNRVFSYKSYVKLNDIYEFKFVADKNAYASFLKRQFPNLSNQDIVLSNMFGEKDSYESTMRINKDGTWIDEKLFTPNVCSDVFQILIGEDANGLAKELTSVATSKDPTELQFEKVENAKSIDQLAADLNI